MKKVVMSVLAALAVAAPAYAADVPVKAVKAPVAPVTPLWDVAIGGAIMSDYNFRGVSQSNKGPSGGAYFEPQFNTSVGQFYVGIAAWAIDFVSAPGYGLTDPSAEVDLYAGWRKSWGPVSLDLGYLYYWYPRETFNGFTGDSDFWEIYAKLGWAITPAFSVGLNVFYTPDLLNYSETFKTVALTTPGVGTGGTDAFYVSATAKWVTPLEFNGIGLFVSGELGHWFIDDSQFIAAGAGPAVVVAGAGIDPSYTYWNAGLGLTYKALTLDLRYHGTDQNDADCASFLATNLPNNAAQKWCGDTFIASLKFDTTLSALK
jgi:uncharacterized protein (TIGR02001 family)